MSTPNTAPAYMKDNTQHTALFDDLPIFSIFWYNGDLWIKKDASSAELLEIDSFGLDTYLRRVLPVTSVDLAGAQVGVIRRQLGYRTGARNNHV